MNWLAPAAPHCVQDDEHVSKTSFDREKKQRETNEHPMTPSNVDSGVTQK